MLSLYLGDGWAYKEMRLGRKHPLYGLLYGGVHLKNSLARTTINEGGFFRWYATLKYSDVRENFNFLKIQDLRPLDTCQKYFETILPNFPRDECDI